MDALRNILERSEPLLLFLVIGIGFLAGQIRIRNFKFGVAGVLFVGLFFGAWAPAGETPFSISHQVMQVGLILFVYSIGLTSGAGFFSSFKQRGARFNLALICALSAGALLTLFIGKWMALQPGQIAGVFCGGLTNTPALAAAGELMKNSGIGNPNDPVIGYSVTYPFGIIGGMLAFQVFVRIFRNAAKKEKTESEILSRMKLSLSTSDYEIRNSELFNKTIGELRIQEQSGVIISRHKHNDMVTVPTKYSILHEGDVITAVGAEADIKMGETFFGARSEAHLEENTSDRITMRRILVSRKELAGKTIEEIELDRRFNAQITRLRRVDIDIVPDHSMTLEIGDRVRVVMPIEHAAEVARYFGDSERGVSELDYTALTLGISLGVLLGMIPIPIPGGSYVSLGFAGGPLVAGLILGKLGRTKNLIWSIPAESNRTLRHIGLLFFLAAIGVMAGGRFFEAISSYGWQLFSLGFITTSVTTGLTLLFMRYWGKGSIIDSIGATCGMQTQPATLAYAYDMFKSDDVYVSYATTYPVAMVGKILIAQLLIIVANLLY